jgi:hypothetical protein
MTNETTAAVEEPIYIRPAVVCRISMTKEEIKVESVTIEREGVRALHVFRNEEEAEDWRREYGIYPEAEGFKVLPAEDDIVRYLLELHQCTHVVTPVSWLGEDGADLFTVENFIKMLEESAPA